MGYQDRDWYKNRRDNNSFNLDVNGRNKSINYGSSSSFQKFDNTPFVFSFVEHVIYPFVFYVFGFFIYFFIALNTGGQNLSLFSNIVIFHIIYFIILFNFYRNR